MKKETNFVDEWLNLYGDENIKKEVDERFEKKTTTANTSISVDCYCPYCGESQDILYEEDTRLALGNEFSVDDVEIEIECKSCSEKFIVTDIYY